MRLSSASFVLGFVLLLAACGGSGGTSYEAPAVTEVGIEIELVSSNSEVVTLAEEPGSSDWAEFTFVVAITADGGVAYVDERCFQREWMEDGRTNVYSVSDPESVDTWCSVFSTADWDDDAERFRVDDGETEYFTFVIGATVTTDAFVQVELIRVGWQPDTALVGDQQQVVDLEGFESDSLFLNYMEEVPGPGGKG